MPRHAPMAMLRRLTVVLVFGACSASAGQAPVVLTPERQNELEQVALARARTELFGLISALPIRADLAVGDWLARDVDLDRAVRAWARARPRQGAARIYHDAVCEVDVLAEPAAVADMLLNLLEKYFATATPIGIDAGKLKSAARGWPLLWATGRVAYVKNLRVGQPVGWEDVTAEGVELARGAATAAALKALLLDAERLKVTNARRLREFLDSSPAVRDAVQAELQRAAKVKVDFAPDQVATAEARVSFRDLLRILTRVHQELYRGDDFEAADFREMALLAGQEDLVVTGLGTPPSHTFLNQRFTPVEYDVPDWANKTLSDVGRYHPAEGETSDEVARREAARLDAVARLARQVEQLVIQRDVTVAEFLGYHQELKDDVALFLSGTRVVSQPSSLRDGGVEVKVELPLRRLWDIVRRAMKREEVEPPESGTPEQHPSPPGAAKRTSR